VRKGANALNFILFMAASSKSVSAKTIFDTDVYGDKELKIATVNKIKQKIRNAILQTPEIAPHLLELAISDALGYDAYNGEGGQDGSILFELSADSQGLNKALAALKDIQKELQRTNTVAFGDLVAFGGGEALETVGCGRVIIQVGRFDAKKSNEGITPIFWEGTSGAPSDVIAAFKRSGFRPQQIACLLGALGEVKRVVKEDAIATQQKSSVTEEDEDEPEEPFVPTSFGSRSEIFGARLGKADFGSKYLASLLDKKSKITAESDFFGYTLLQDDAVKTFVQKYAASDNTFIKDVTETYLALTKVGEAYTTRNS